MDPFYLYIAGFLYLSVGVMQVARYCISIDRSFSEREYGPFTIIISLLILTVGWPIFLRDL